MSRLNIEFKHQDDQIWLQISGRRKSSHSTHSILYCENIPAVRNEDLKSIMIDRNEEFVNHLGEEARQNYINITGENALTWNVFRTLTISNRWDILFSAEDILTGGDLLAGNWNQVRRPENFFWNIAPGAGHFSYHFARLIFDEEVSIYGSVDRIEPDFFAFFDSLTLSVESKLRSGFDRCNRKKRNMCRGKRACKMFLFFDRHFEARGFPFRGALPEDCDIHNQLYRNLMIAHLLNDDENRSEKPLFLLNVLNERSDRFPSNLSMARDFRMNMEAGKLPERQNHQFGTTSWQKIRNRIEAAVEENGREDPRLNKLLLYLRRHPYL